MPDDPHRAAPWGDRLREWPSVCVLAGVLLALGVVAAGWFRAGALLLAGAVLLAMFLRLLLRDDEAGLLAVRSRYLDAFTLLVLGSGLAVLAFVIPA